MTVNRTSETNDTGASKTDPAADGVAVGGADINDSSAGK